MPSARMSRGLVSLAASAITAVYIAGYVHTQSADAVLGTTDAASVVVQTASPVPAATPAIVPVAADAAVPHPTATAAAVVITDAAVEVYADQHHLSWDDARAQMKAAGGIEAQAPTLVATPTSGAPDSSAPRATATTVVRPTATPVVRSAPTATVVVRSAPVAPTPTPAKPVASAFKDGTYTGLGTSRRGDIKVSLAVLSGRIASVTITGATTQYPTRLIAGLPNQVVSRQSAQVDTISGATYSSLAFRAAVQQALQNAHA